MFNLPSLLVLKKVSERKTDTDNSVDDNNAPVKRRKERFNDWLLPKPEPIALYAGEKELFRKGLVLVTDTRLAYIDPFDRMLKTYMFEHMISVHKQFYRTTLFNRRLCKALLLISLLVLLIMLTIDLLDSSSSGFFLIYIPLIASMFIGIKVWNDMKPRYVLHWRMRDLSFGEITQEPMLRERILGSNKREEFMNELANAMNEALSTKGWWPDNHAKAQVTQANHEADTNSVKPPSSTEKQTLKLVTDNYQ